VSTFSPPMLMAWADGAPICGKAGKSPRNGWERKKPTISSLRVHAAFFPTNRPLGCRNPAGPWRAWISARPGARLATDVLLRAGPSAPREAKMVVFRAVLRTGCDPSINSFTPVWK